MTINHYITVVLLGVDSLISPSSFLIPSGNFKMHSFLYPLGYLSLPFPRSRASLLRCFRVSETVTDGGGFLKHSIRRTKWVNAIAFVLPPSP